MSKNKILLITNPLMGLLVISQLVTGLNADRLGKWFDTVHVIPGILLAVLVVVHVVLNWPWVRTSYFKRPQSKR